MLPAPASQGGAPLSWRYALGSQQQQHILPSKSAPPAACQLVATQKHRNNVLLHGCPFLLCLALSGRLCLRSRT